ncbi:MAG: polyprenyl synthetase family protein, partial [bacterium]
MDNVLYQHRYEELVKGTEKALRELTPAATTRPQRLHSAIRYSLDAGGKRLRPVLCLATTQAFQPYADALHAAVALECIHSYSLIHDDLPCMDDSDLRRGHPSCHKAFDEATALLAGDALIPMAFQLIADGYAKKPAIAQALVAELSRAAGSQLLVGGQAEDMNGSTPGDAVDRLDFILRGKTAALISAPF